MDGLKQPVPPNIPEADLELVGIGEVGECDSGGTGEGDQTGSGDEGGLGLFLGAGGFDLHLGFDRPDVGLSVLINGNTTLDGCLVVLGKDGNGGTLLLGDGGESVGGAQGKKDDGASRLHFDTVLLKSLTDKI